MRTDMSRSLEWLALERWMEGRPAWLRERCRVGAASSTPSLNVRSFVLVAPFRPKISASSRSRRTCFPSLETAALPRLSDELAWRLDGAVSGIPGALSLRPTGDSPGPTRHGEIQDAPALAQAAMSSP